MKTLLPAIPPANDELDTCDRSERLMGRWRDGAEQSAFRELADRYQPRLERLVARRLPHDILRRVEAQDLVQEIMARALSSVSAFQDRGRGSLWAWVRGISNHVLHDVWRRQDRSARVEFDVDNTRAHPDSDEASPLSQLLTDERGRQALEAIGHLKERERRAILLRLECRHSFKAIAKALGYPSVDAARMAVARSLRLVGDRLAGTGAADSVHG